MKVLPFLCSDMTTRAHFQLLVHAEVKVGIRQNLVPQYVNHGLDKSKSRANSTFAFFIFLKGHSLGVQNDHSLKSHQLWQITNFETLRFP